MILGILVATFILLIICATFIYLFTLDNEDSEGHYEDSEGQEEEHEDVTTIPSSPMNVV